MRHTRGFTLLEVLIALAILALSAAAVLRQAQIGVKQQYELELKSSALWVADDALTVLLTQSQWPPLGRAEQQQSYQGQEWRISTDVEATDDPMMRRIEVSIAAAEPTGAPALITLTAYRGRY